jgi:hypothetical protein
MGDTSASVGVGLFAQSLRQSLKCLAEQFSIGGHADLQCGLDPNPIIADIGRDASNQARNGDFEDLANLQDFGH